MDHGRIEIAEGLLSGRESNAFAAPVALNNAEGVEILDTEKDGDDEDVQRMTVTGPMRLNRL